MSRIRTVARQAVQFNTVFCLILCRERRQYTEHEERDGRNKQHTDLDISLTIQNVTTATVGELDMNMRC